MGALSNHLTTQFAEVSVVLLRLHKRKPFVMIKQKERLELKVRFLVLAGKDMIFLSSHFAFSLHFVANTVAEIS